MSRFIDSIEIESFIAIHKDVNARMSDGDTALHAALRLGDGVITLVSRLLDLRADIYIPDSSGRTALDIALTPKDTCITEVGKAVVTYIMQNNFDPDAIIKASTRETLLHILTKLTNTGDLVQELLSNGASFDIQDAEGKTALESALTCRSGLTYGGRALVKAYMSRDDFHPNHIVIPSTGQTLLHALMNLFGTQEIIEELLTKGAHFDIPDLQGKTALELAISPGFNFFNDWCKPVVKAYMSRDDLHPNHIVIPSTGETLLHRLIKLIGTRELVEELILKGARFDIPDLQGKTALEISLTSQGFKAVGRDARGITHCGEILVKAYMSRSDFEKDIIVIPSTGETLLHRLMKLESTSSLVQKLLSKGARFDIPDLQGKTALDSKHIDNGTILLAFKAEQDLLSASASAASASGSASASASAAALPASELHESGEDGDIDLSYAAAAAGVEISGDHQEEFHS